MDIVPSSVLFSADLQQERYGDYTHEVGDSITTAPARSLPLRSVRAPSSSLLWRVTALLPCCLPSLPATLASINADQVRPPCHSDMCGGVHPTCRRYAAAAAAATTPIGVQGVGQGPGRSLGLAVCSVAGRQQHAGIPTGSAAVHGSCCRGEGR